MTNQTAQKVRLVKCPKCKEILPELAAIPVYQCGGCGAFLQAKRPNHMIRERPRKDEANTISENELELSNDKEAQSSSQAAISTGRMIHPTEIENHGIEESSFDPEPEKVVDQEHTVDNEKLLANINHPEEVVPTNQQKEGNEFPDVASNQNEKQLEDVKCEVAKSAEFVQQESEESSPPSENYDESSATDENDELSPNIGITVNEEEEIDVLSKDLILKPSGDSNCTFEVSPPIKLSQETGYDEFGRECDRDANPSVIIASSEDPSPTHGTNTDLDQHPSSSDSSLSVFRLSTDTNLEPPYGLLNDQPGTIALRSVHSISSDETIGDTKIPPLDAPAAYFSYEGSVSSFDGIEDQAPPLYPQRRLHDQMRNFSSLEKDHAMECKKLHQYELPEDRRYGYPVRIPYRKTEHRSGLSTHPNNYRSFDYGSTSTCGCNDLNHNRRNFDVVNRVQYAEDKKMELLEMINELQDQLNDIHVPMENVRGKLTNGGCNTNRERRPPFYDPILAAETYSRCEVHSRKCQISRTAFSAESPYSRHQADPRTRNYSAELPPCQMGRNYRRPSRSGPQNFYRSDSSLLSSDWKYDDICHKNNNVMKNLIKDRLHSGKKQVRPTVGGAPFVVCYHCTKLLQLPTDFVVFKNKKSHRLRCGSCSHVLRFSFENDNCMLPKIQSPSGVVAPPPSEVNVQSGVRSYAESTRIRIRATKKFSTGAEFEESRAISPVVERSRNVNEKGVPSTNIEKAKPASSSTLHKLMGYSSPSQVFFRGKSTRLKQTLS
ncbi:uncharacterized protein LOC124930193 [Impatiens glandulifera]|uniref:uncharacterized protein LOC124930193 n=1 Tax=Impatiens glandulifera TaxID=253017 RepID=UPI001FB16714|nr:uncharacterized protein LOC124930193 [Impatiens glandulifera]